MAPLPLPDQCLLGQTKNLLLSRTSLTSSAFIGERNMFISSELLQLRYGSSTVCDNALDSLAFNVNLKQYILLMSRVKS